MAGNRVEGGGSEGEEWGDMLGSLGRVRRREGDFGQEGG